jgi:hypothetical protein
VLLLDLPYKLSKSDAAGRIRGSEYDRITPDYGKAIILRRKRPGIKHVVTAIVFLRVMSSLAWLDGAFIGKDAKLAPSFLSGAGLGDTVAQKFVHTALSPAVVNILQNIALPRASVFAQFVAFGDLAIGPSLSLGLFIRLGGTLAIVRAMTNIPASTFFRRTEIFVLGAPEERKRKRQVFI